MTLISYLIYKYWLKLLNTNKIKNKINFYNFLNFELYKESNSSKY